MPRTAPTTRPRYVIACVAAALALGAAGCGGDDATSFTVADLNADAVDELDLRDALFARHSPAEWTDDTSLTAADVALYRTVATIYSSRELQRGFVVQALDEWEDTASSLRSRRTQPGDSAEDTAARDRGIEEFKAQLERIVESDADVDVDFFLQIPAVDRMIIELEGEYAAAGLTDVG